MHNSYCGSAVCSSDLGLSERKVFQNRPAAKRPTVSSLTSGTALKPGGVGDSSTPLVVNWDRTRASIAWINSSPPLASNPPEIAVRSEEHTSELQSLMRISYAVFCLKKKTKHNVTMHKITTI